MEYKVIEYKQAPKAVQEWIDKNKETDNYTTIHVKNKTYIVILMGRKASGGYEIKLISIDEQNDTLEIKLKYITPPNDQIVIQMITYPYLIIEMEKTTKKILLKIDK